jgi:hypothetical protein
LWDGQAVDFALYRHQARIRGSSIM